MREMSEDELPVDAEITVGEDGVSAQWLGEIPDPPPLPPEEQAINDRYASIAEVALAGDWREALCLMDAWMAEDPAMRSRMCLVRFDMALKAGAADAYEYGWGLLRGELRDQSGMLWLMGRCITDNDALTDPDVWLLLALATRSAILTHHEDGNIESALAWAHYLVGDVRRAVAIQEAAWLLVASNQAIPQELKAKYQQRLHLMYGAAGKL